MSLPLKKILQGQYISAVEVSGFIKQLEGEVFSFILVLGNGTRVEFRADEAWGALFISYEISSDEKDTEERATVERVDCDDNCGALKNPQTLAEYMTACRHWREHLYLGGPV